MTAAGGVKRRGGTAEPHHNFDLIPADISAIMPCLRYDRALLAAATVAVALAAAAAPARAQGRLDGLYTASLAGIPLGKGEWIVDIGDGQYSAAVSGVTTGLLRVFASGQGTGMARGAIASNGALVPSLYAATITANKRTEELRMALAGGVVKDLSIEPPTPPVPERIPVTDAHRRGVLDPMTASLVRVPGNADPMSPEACAQGASVFDGRLRYDLTMAFRRMETVKAEKGYAGPVVVCTVFFNPIAGYIPDRPAIKYLTRQRDMEVWLAPIAGTRIVVPYRVAIPTPLGTAALQATEFVSAPRPPRPTPTSARVQ